MTYTVFFREDNAIITAGNFIKQQPEPHQELLQRISDALASTGQIDHPLVTKVGKSEWSVLVKEKNGDVYIYTLFISQLENPETAEKKSVENSRKQRELVVIDPSGPRDSAGGYHPGYWSVAHYSSLLEEAQRTLFLKTINQIEHNISSDSYSINNDGSVSIHIHKQERAYTISVVCRVEFR